LAVCTRQRRGKLVPDDFALRQWLSHMTLGYAHGMPTQAMRTDQRSRFRYLARDLS
jgi:hypothetical protein